MQTGGGDLVALIGPVVFIKSCVINLLFVFCFKILFRELNLVLPSAIVARPDLATSFTTKIRPISLLVDH